MGRGVLVEVGSINIQVGVTEGAGEAVQVGNGVTLGVRVGGMKAAVRVAAAPAVAARAVLNETGSSVGPAGCGNAGCKPGWPPLVAAAAAAAVFAIAVFISLGPSVATMGVVNAGEQARTINAAAAIQCATRLPFISLSKSLPHSPF
jgi:hypothetical protein